MSRLPPPDDMVAAIVATYQAATPGHIRSGRAWYPAAGRMVRSIARETGHPVERIAFALAALSPRNPWRWNVADVYALATADIDRNDVPTLWPRPELPQCSTFRVNVDRAWATLHDGIAPWLAAAPKVRAFAAAILGDTSAVVVDVWAARIATAGRVSAPSNAEYASIAAAYEAAAIILAIPAAEVQAVTWLVAQSDGLGSNRRGRHDVRHKRGTAPFVVDLFLEAPIA